MCTIQNIYPNPVNNIMYVPLSLDKGATITMDIYNILGVKVYQSGEMNFTAGEHLILKNIDLNSGQYLVSFRINYVLRSSLQHLQKDCNTSVCFVFFLVISSSFDMCCSCETHQLFFPHGPWPYIS